MRVSSMSTIRFLTKIFTIFISLFIFTACTSSEDITVEKDTYQMDKHIDNSFSISFWLKPKYQCTGSRILKIGDELEEINLISNSEDENYYDTGLALVSDNGSIYLDGESYLETNNYNFVSIVYYDNTFFLYLNGNLLGEGVLTEKLDNHISIEIGSDKFSGEFLGFSFTDKILMEEDIKNYFYKDMYYLLDNIDYPETFKEDASGKVSLPHSRYKIDYQSDDEVLLIDDHYLYFNETEEKDKKATLHASLNIDEHIVSKEIEFIINKSKDINDIKRVIENKLDYCISSSESFPNEIESYDISYKVLDDKAYFEEGHFIKKVDEEKSPIEIEVSISNHEEKISFNKSVILLDEYVGYLLVYFDGHDGWPEHITGEESIYLAYSDDLITYTKLNEDKIIETNMGTNRFRDPYICRDKDGNFIIVATEAYENPTSYLINSEDMINFDIKQIDFTVRDRSIGLNALKTYAPEIIYNEIEDTYTIIYSEPSSKSSDIYAVDTKDFINYSMPYIYLDTDYQVIDANVTMIDDKYYLFYKDESNGNIYYATSDDILDPVWQIHDDHKLNEIVAEGPFVLNSKRDDRQYLYLDAYKSNMILRGEIDKLEDISLEIDEGISTIKGVRHFSIIELTQREKERILDYYE